MNYPLISKYFFGNATEEEVEEIFEWMDADPENREVLTHLKKVWVLGAKSDEDCEIAWERLQQNIKNRNRKKQQLQLMKYAAVFVAIIGIAFFFQREISAPEDYDIEKGAITLKLENGNIEIITDKGGRKILDKNGKVVGNQKGNVLNYNDSTSFLVSSKSVYNELTIPLGKTFKLVLSDGTKVHLNAGSSVKYPVKFIKGVKREIFLKGEAFFDVARNELDPFVVNSKNLKIRVLGTKFNVSSYPEDENVNTVLVEGSVALHEKGSAFDSEDTTLLAPGFKAEWSQESNNISVAKVDTKIYTSWVQGKMIFRDTPFKVIRKKLERHYNVSIKNNNKTLEEKTYNANFDVESIEQVLHTLNEIYPIKYTIKNKEIVIS